MEREAIIVMIWKGTKSKTERRNEIKADLVNRFKAVFPFTVNNNTVLFTLPDGMIMSVVSLGGTHFDDIVMNYKSPDGWDNDDGDLYHIDDYTTIEELFSAMLSETYR